MRKPPFKNCRDDWQTPGPSGPRTRKRAADMRRKPFPLQIIVTSNGEKIGTLTTAQFMDYCRDHGAPKRAFLTDMVAAFNDYKARVGEPERVEVTLIKTH